MSADLYHNRILELASDIPHLGALEDAGASVEQVSRICGSTIRLDLTLTPDRTHIAAIAVDPKACALGQAATAILTGNAVGASVEEVREAHDALRAMLKDNGPPPGGRFAELRHLAGVADYPPRHTSTLLAFRAAVDAIDAILAADAADAPAIP
ncbi:MAG: iron-sulfur cluster assembly scaffold protein [Pseudomonadota bacterium]